jgi:pimeloyl-ACP methyl ester carboxylesterase
MRRVSSGSRCWGVSQGAAIAVVYAARHLERVSDLVLSGGYARGPEVFAGLRSVGTRRR